MTILSPSAQFEQIIRYQSSKELVPFLLGSAKTSGTTIREGVKHLRRELDRRDASTNWQAAITHEQEEMLQLAAIATATATQALRPSMRFWFGLRFDQRREFWQVLKNTRPSWLTSLLLSQARSANTLGIPLYSFIRKLEKRQILPFEPELFAKTLPNWLSEIGAILSSNEPVPLNASTAVMQLVAEDPIALGRDLMLLFEFETHVEKVKCRVQKRPGPTEDWAGRWQVWNRLHPPQGVEWTELFVGLTASNYLDRADILARCLLALRRDFRRPLLTWFRNLFLALQPTQAEIISRQGDFIELLPHATPLVVNFALDQLHSVLLAPGFRLAALLPGAEQLFARPELKTGLRKLLAGLPKLLKQNTHQAAAIAKLCAAALPYPDGQVQEAAAKGLAGLLALPTPLLTAEEMATLIAAIEGHAALLNSPARKMLAAWLDIASSRTDILPAPTYAPISHFVPDISPTTAIVPVRDWHELLFLTGQVLRHDDPAALERWLDGLLHLRHTLPDGYATQLRPYLAQLLPQIKTATEAEVAALLSGPLRLFGHQGLAQALLLSWLTGFAGPRVASVQVARTPLVLVEQQRYEWAESLLRGQQVLPLLSTPTHAPAWVAPDALLARLLAYQAAGQRPNVADLAVALARTAHTHAGRAAEALRQLLHLADLGLRELLGWFLGPADAPLPPLPPAPGSRQAASLQAPGADALPELWAVAARTKAPGATFPALPAALGYDHPGATQPAIARWQTEQHEQTVREMHLPGQPTTTHRWTELRWGGGPGVAAPSPLHLYTTGPGANEHGSWEHNQMLAGDFNFLAALLPNAADTLYAYVLNSAAWADNLEASERDLVALALRQLLTPGPGFGPAETALLASGLIHHTGLCRSLAQEVLLRAVANGRLRPADLGATLGGQLAASYAPVLRLADILKPLQGLDALTDDALRQLLDALLLPLPDKPLRNLGKLLESYASLRAGIATPLPTAMQQRLVLWQPRVSLKALVNSLLN